MSFWAKRNQWAPSFRTIVVFLCKRKPNEHYYWKFSALDGSNCFQILLLLLTPSVRVIRLVEITHHYFCNKALAWQVFHDSCDSNCMNKNNNSMIKILDIEGLGFGRICEIHHNSDCTKTMSTPSFDFLPNYLDGFY